MSIKQVPPAEFRVPAHFSYSSLDEWCLCPRRTYYHRIQGLVPLGNAPAPEFGKAWHLLMEAHYKGASPAEALEAFRAYWQAYLDTGEVLIGRKAEMYTMERVEKMYAAYRAKYASENFEVLAHEGGTELGFELPLGDTTYKGIIDLVIRRPNYGVVVMDHKTSSRIDSFYQKTLNPSLQFTGYVWAAEQHFENVYGVCVNGTLCAKVEVKHERFWQTYSRLEIEEWKREVVRYMDEIKREVEAGAEGLWPRHTNACNHFNSTCPYHLLCTSREPFMEQAASENLYRRAEEA